MNYVWFQQTMKAAWWPCADVMPWGPSEQHLQTYKEAHRQAQMYKVK